MADVEKAAVVRVSANDAEITAKASRTRIALVAVCGCMIVFCCAMLGYFASELNNTVGGSCPGYEVDTGCMTLKENWCKVSMCNEGGTGLMGDEYFGDTYASNSCPQGCSGACSADGQNAEAGLESWKAMLVRFDACRERTSRVRECLPTLDTDGSLANYRGYKTAHPSLGLSGTTAFIQREAFLDACDAQEVYADRRERGGKGVLAMIVIALISWFAMSVYVCMKPNYTKYPRENTIKPLKLIEKISFNHRYHPDSLWLWYSTFNALLGFAIQLYSFYTPSTKDTRIPIAQGTWMTLEVLTRSMLMLLDKFIIVEASAIFFDVGFAIVGFTALLDPFFEPAITTQLPEVDASITDYALGIRTISFIFPLISSTMKVKGLYVDNYWPSPSTVKAMMEKTRDKKKLIIKSVLFALQLGAAFSVFGIMGSDSLCHSFRTCSRASCTPNIPAGLPLDVELINGNQMQRQELISDDGTMKWRWQINTQTKLKFTKVDGTLYADMRFDIPNGAIENRVSEPGSQAEYNVRGNTPSSACEARFEVQCQEANPRHAFKELTKSHEWVDYNTSMYKLVARHEYESTSGTPSCFSSSSEWWTDDAMFVGGENLAVGGTTDSPDVGYVLMEQTNCCYSQNGNDCTTKTDYCLVEPPFVGVYTPYGRATVQGNWEWDDPGSMPGTWGTSLHSFELKINPAISSTDNGGPNPNPGGDPNGGDPNGGDPNGGDPNNNPPL